MPDTKRSALLLVFHCGLGGSEAGDGYTERRARSVVHADTGTELHAAGLSTVLTADTGAQSRTDNVFPLKSPESSAARVGISPAYTCPVEPLSDPDSMIAIVSTIRRGGTVIPFLYGILILREPNAKQKIACLTGVLLGLLCLTLATI